MVSVLKTTFGSKFVQEASMKFTGTHIKNKGGAGS